MKRRDFLKTAGVLAAGSALSSPLASAGTLVASPLTAPGDGDLNNIDLPIKGLMAKVDKPVSVIVIGAGSRGRTYSRYASLYPEAMKVVGVSDILDHRLKSLADGHKVAPEMRFGHFREVFASGKKLADAVAICTPDDRHYEPCMKALELGYDVLLEKPVAQTEKQCRNILAQAKKYGRIVAVCHVMRYSPYFIAMREVLRSGVIGDIVSIQHMEPIQYAHMAHSYVRGNWRNSKETTPIILAKSCHDLDMMRWLIDKPCKSIVADGSLHLFKAENAPEGATSNVITISDVEFGKMEGDKETVKTIEAFMPFGPNTANAENTDYPWQTFNGTDEDNERGVGSILSLGRPQDPHHGHPWLHRRRRQRIHGDRFPHPQKERVEQEDIRHPRIPRFRPRRRRPCPRTRLHRSGRSSGAFQAVQHH